MTTVDPAFLFLPVPKKLRDDPEIGPWIETLVAMQRDVWERTGGAEDTIDGTATTVTAQGTEIDTAQTDITALQASVTALQSTVDAIATGSPTYTPTNESTDRTWDCNAAEGAISMMPTQAEVENIRDAVLEVSDVLATLANDLATKGITG